ncbi:ATV_HP_G0147020.mRNA.1.CDS.1 [Saccharomyces cerevisiae]|nr:ATV_HP_G0147020.mRNA.1.CDS.1 [Saccharomyces cerevisiae]CAI6924871.1 ATV_HP_G0147020.mRNA.1.CDS.1 [Saccharomyces cerevisiae]
MNKKYLFLDTVDKNEPEAHERSDQSVVISEKFANTRSGKEGSSVLFICKDELPFVRELEDAKNIVIAKQENMSPVKK